MWPGAERLEQPVAGDHRADRRVAGGHALGAGDDVGHVAEVVAGEHAADPAERADHLVGDEQHVVPVADLAQPLEVAGRRREAAAGVLHRLDEHRGHGVRALEQDRLLHPVGGPAPERLEVAAEALGGAVGVGVGHLERARHQRLVGRAQRGQAGDGQRALRGAVVGDRPADHLGLAGLAGELEVLLGQLPRALHGLAAAGGEEDPVEVARGRSARAARPGRSPPGARSPRSGRRPARTPAARRPRPARGGRARPAPRTARPARPGSCGPGRPRSGSPHRAR